MFVQNNNHVDFFELFVYLYLFLELQRNHAFVEEKFAPMFRC